MNDRDVLRLLAGRLIDGTATGDEAARLSELLRERADLRDEYASFLATHAALCWRFRSEAVVGPQPVVVAPQATALSRFVPWVLAAAAVVTLLIYSRHADDRPISHPPTDIASATPAAVAVLVDSADAEFAAARGPAGGVFQPGSYDLQSGVVHLRFAQGVELIASGPAQWEIVDAAHVRLTDGAVRVVAPPSGAGFTVATSDVEYVDLGTEFGLRVAADTGTADLFVFDGQVNVADPGSGRVLREVYEGDATRHVQGVAAQTPTFDDADFPNPAAIGLVRWKDERRRIASAKNVVAYFPFERSAQDSVLVNAHVDRRAGDGRIVGARWASGRWPGKDALLFDRDDDRVELDVAGEFDEFTVAAWLKVDRLDFEMNAIFNSDRAPSGGLHFQLTRQGVPRGGVLGVKSQQTSVGDSVLVGRWTHAALVVSTTARTQEIYLDGRLSQVRPLEGDSIVRPGTLRVGNWLPASSDADTFRGTRSLRGRIDELTLWDRVLSPEEIGRLAAAGRPGLFGNEPRYDLTAAP